MATPLDILLQYFGYTSFKPPQEEIIRTVLSKKNVLAVLPTGSGKSICYQIPALVNDGICLVVSPLIALMQDQVAALNDKGIKSVTLNASQNPEETITLFDNLRFGNYKFLFLSPEKLQSEFIQQKISQLHLNLIAIDEAHCISEWGHDFRPSYLKVKKIKELHPNIPIIALTATATPSVINDVIKQLELTHYQLFKESVVRNNIAIRIIQHQDTYKHLLHCLGTDSKPSIIYVNSRKKTKDISRFLKQNNIESSFYHGGLSLEEKQLAYTHWKNEKTPVMIATNAFGMGIDKDNVSQIIHLDLPTSLENYVQEAGRAGRNGKASISTLFVNDHTLSQLKSLTKKSILTIEFIKYIYTSLNGYYQISYGELPQKFYIFNLTDFCTIYKTNTLQTFQALRLLEREGILIFDTFLNRQSTLKFIVSSHHILNYSNNSNSELIPTILRSYGGVFDQYIGINEVLLAKKLKTTTASVKNELLKIAKDGMVSYNYSKNTNKIFFTKPREDQYTINTISKYIINQNEIKIKKMKAVVHFVTTTKACRTHLLATYFGETVDKTCNTCDICTTTTTEISKDKRKLLSLKIIELLSIKKELSTQEICTELKLDNTIVISILRILLDDHKIKLTSQNKLQIK